MNAPRDRQRLLFRMEEARRQTQHQLDLIDRQIIRRTTALVPSPDLRRSAYRLGRSVKPKAVLARYHANFAALTAERQPEIDALSCKLDRQEAAITGCVERCGFLQACLSEANAG